MSQLALQGWTQAAIAEELGVSQPTVAADLKAVHRQWKESVVQDLELARAIELAKLDRIEREAWDAWQRSQRPAETAVVSGQAEDRQMRRSVKHQHGDPRFLEVVHKSIAQKRALLGLDVSPLLSEEHEIELGPDVRRDRIFALVATLRQRAGTAATGNGPDAGQSGDFGLQDQRGPLAAGAAPDAAEPGDPAGAG